MSPGDRWLALAAHGDDVGLSDNVSSGRRKVCSGERHAARFFKDRNMTVEIPDAVLSERQASQGIKLGHMRYVLALSLVLCAAVGTLFYFFH
jgi:hypothetical protein